MRVGEGEVYGIRDVHAVGPALTFPFPIARIWVGLLACSGKTMPYGVMTSSKQSVTPAVYRPHIVPGQPMIACGANFPGHCHVLVQCSVFGSISDGHPLATQNEQSQHFRLHLVLHKDMPRSASEEGRLSSLWCICDYSTGILYCPWRKSQLHLGRLPTESWVKKRLSGTREEVRPPAPVWRLLPPD